jgi:superfamily II DNA or RNA helicase
MGGVRPFFSVLSNSNERNDLAGSSSHISVCDERIAQGTYLDYAYDRDKCVVFCVDVEHSTKMAEEFNKAEIPAAVIHGSLKKEDRKQLLEDFHNGKLRVLTNCAVLTEGWNEPALNCVIHAAPTKSSLLYTQKTGRGTRLSPEAGKQDCLVIDVVDITRRHSLTTVADLFGLPPQFNVKGEDVLEVAKKFEEAKKANQHLLMDDCQSRTTSRRRSGCGPVHPRDAARREGVRAVGMVAGLAGPLPDVVPRGELP